MLGSQKQTLSCSTFEMSELDVYENNKSINITYQKLLYHLTLTRYSDLINLFKYILTTLNFCSPVSIAYC